MRLIDVRRNRSVVSSVLNRVRLICLLSMTLIPSAAGAQTEPAAGQTAGKPEPATTAQPAPAKPDRSQREKNKAARAKSADKKAAQDKRNQKQAAQSKPESAPAAQPKPSPTEDRLEVIEQALKQLISEVKTLRESRTGADSSTDSKEGSGSQSKQEDQKPPAAKTVTTPRSVASAGSRRTPAAAEMKLSSDWLKEVRWRSIGPANMGGRITDLAIHDRDPSLWWVATASGGLLKTTNRGMTIEHQFDDQNTVSIGAIATARTNKNIIWVGTGEANPRNSVSYGDGVYKSVDGGKTWKHMGLKQSFQIGRILIHPKNPNIVYVGALGRLYGPNPERGVFKTTDGGETWEKVLYVDDRTGVIDMIQHPRDPDTIIAALWDRQRDGYDSWPGQVPKIEGVDSYDPIRKWGPGGGLYRTTDGGQTWKKLSQGLPTGMTGRIGLDWQAKSPHVVYAIIDCENIGKGPAPFTAYLGLVGIDSKGQAGITQVIPESPAATAKVQVSDQLLAVDGKPLKAFDELLDVLRKKKVGDQIKLRLQRAEKQIDLEIPLTARPSVNQRNTVWLGVSGSDRERKVILSQIIAGSPAQQAGLKAGDVVTHLGGKPVTTYQAMIAQIGQKKAGDKIALKVKRKGKSIAVPVTLANRPSSGSRSSRPNVYMGIQGENAEKSGAKLTAITPGGPAEKAGLKSGDIVLAFDSQKLANYAELVTAIRSHKADDKVKVQFERGGKAMTVELTFASRPGGPSKVRPYTYSYYGQTPNIQDMQGAQGFEYGGVYRSDDAGETWQRVNSLNTRPMYFSVIRVDPSDERRVYVLGVAQFRSDNGGATFTANLGRNVHADSHDLWIDPRDGRHMVIGGDGGFYVTHDRGENWDHINTSAIGQFYHVTISPRSPYWVYGGLQDNGSWGGPAISRNGGAINEDWLSIGGGDGFVCRVDPEDPDLIYYESQNGAMARRHLKTGERASIRPERPADGVSYRFNWMTPFILSHHNSKIFYSAGNYVFRSLNQGRNLVPISPEITLTQRGSATALSESPRDPNVIYVGTDDGALWVTRDGGQQWTNITDRLGIPAPRWVATIEASRYAPGRVYVCLDGHRSNDDDPYVLVSEDFGDTWRSIRSNLPWGSSRCLREDPVNANMLYVGTEFAAWVSLDRGANWLSLNTNLPTVAIHEIAIHPTNGEIVAATHGRSLWACDISALRELKPQHLTNQIALMTPQEVIRWRSEPNRGRTNRRFVSQNPPSGAQFWYSLPTPAKSVVLKIEDVDGRTIRSLNGSTEPGLHRLSWNLVGVTPPARPAAATAAPVPVKTAAVPDSESQAQKEPRTAGDSEKPPANAQARPSGSRNPSSRRNPSRPVGNGTYRAILYVDGVEVPAQHVAIVRDPNAPENAIAEEIIEQRMIEDARAAEAKRAAKLAGQRVHADD